MSELLFDDSYFNPLMADKLIVPPSVGVTPVKAKFVPSPSIDVTPVVTVSAKPVEAKVMSVDAKLVPSPLVGVKIVSLNVDAKGDSFEEECKRLLKLQVEEVVLTETPTRYLPEPILYPTLEKFYEQSLEAEWNVAEVKDVAKDRDDYLACTTAQQRMLERVLAYFSGSDGIVQDNLAACFMTEVQLPEAKAFYSVQIKMEEVHKRAYSLMLHTLIEDKQKLQQLLYSIRNIPTIKRKADWSLKWMDRVSLPFAVRLLAFILVEGIFFSTSFLTIYWFRRKSIVKAICKFNDWIAGDEGKHTDFGIELFRMLKHRPSTELVHTMFREAGKIEQEFIRDTIIQPQVGLDANVACNYTCYMMNRMLKQLGYPILYPGLEVAPVEWMIMIGMHGKSNMHEDKSIIEYHRIV